jgi:hypothetical protein
MILTGYHATDCQLNGALHARTWFAMDKDACGFYWSGPECGGVLIGAHVTMSNPLQVSANAFREAYPHGPTWFLQQAVEQGFDSVIIHGIHDGDRVTTVFATVGEPDYVEFSREGAQ